jgi:hypothetical protein
VGAFDSFAVYSDEGGCLVVSLRHCVGKFILRNLRFVLYIQVYCYIKELIYFSAYKHLTGNWNFILPELTNYKTPVLHFFRQSGYCGHITVLFYQLAHKKMTLEIIPPDVAKTSLPQTWHIPRGPKLHGDKADNIVVQGYDREKSAASSH